MNRRRFSKRVQATIAIAMTLCSASSSAANGPTLQFAGGVTSGQLAQAYDLALNNLININSGPYDTTQDATGLIVAPANIISPGDGYRGQVWTRDASVNALSAGSLLEPNVAANTLWAACARESGTGKLITRQSDAQFWDRVIWIVAAWNHFTVTGDTAFLTNAFEAATESLKAAESEHYDTELGLFVGPSHINDGISGYPAPPASDPELDSSSFDNANVRAMMALSTNALHYRAYEDAARMANALGRPASEAASLRAKADAVKSAINTRLWLPQAGRYGYFVHGAQGLRGQVDTSQEALGLALAIDYGIASAEQISSIMAHVSIAPRGIPDVYPNFPRYDNAHPGRHNMSIWPYIQGVWASAMASAGNEVLFGGETERLASLAVSPPNAIDRQFYEVYHFQTGLHDGGWQTGGSWGAATNQTWSATAFLRAIYSGLFGMRFSPTELSFAPVLPSSWGTATLRQLRYREMTLDVVLQGAGHTVSKFRLDGQVLKEPVVAGDLTGAHSVEITLTNSLVNVARTAHVTSSSTAPDYPGTNGVNDGKANGYLDNPNPAPGFAGKAPSGLNLGDERASEWVAAPAEKNNAWVRLDWATSTSIRKIRLFDRIGLNDQIVRGTLDFSDGSSFPVGALPNDGFSAFELSFPATSVSWVRFTVNETSTSTFESGLAEFEIYGDAPDAPTPGVPDAGTTNGSSPPDSPADAGSRTPDGGTANPGEVPGPGNSAAQRGCGCSTPGAATPTDARFFVTLLAWLGIALRSRRRRRGQDGLADRRTEP